MQYQYRRNNNLVCFLFSHRALPGTTDYRLPTTGTYWYLGSISIYQARLNDRHPRHSMTPTTLITSFHFRNSRQLRLSAAPINHPIGIFDFLVVCYDQV